MDDPAKVVIVLSLFGSVAYSINAIARAAVAHRRESARLEKDGVPPLTEARLARIEQAVDAIALEVERISEGQRFTTRLLSELPHSSAKPPARQLSANTPT
jgi:hypothetical protein